MMAPKSFTKLYEELNKNPGTRPEPYEGEELYHYVRRMADYLEYKLSIVEDRIVVETTEFMECDTCRAKPGSPILCHGCLHNRAVINKLRISNKDAWDPWRSSWNATRAARRNDWTTTPPTVPGFYWYAMPEDAAPWVLELKYGPDSKPTWYGNYFALPHLSHDIGMFEGRWWPVPIRPPA
jgi:hypothetical protein